MDKAVFRQLMNRPAESHKYDFGHVLVIGGSPGMVGAPMLAAMASLRVGAGLVTIASTPDVIDMLEKRVLEIMTLRLEHGAAEAMLRFIKDRKVSVVVIGPGTEPAFAASLLKSLGDLPLSVIVDGGALAVLAQQPELFSDNFILTPHQGEFDRFEDSKIGGSDFAKQHKIVLVLKGHPSYIYGPGGESHENTMGGPALATAGSGDVLSGIIGGFIGQGITPTKAAQAAVYLHGQAGDFAAESKTVAGVIASDIIESIPSALKLVLEQEL